MFVQLPLVMYMYVVATYCWGNSHCTLQEGLQMVCSRKCYRGEILIEKTGGMVKVEGVVDLFGILWLANC